MNRIIVGLAGLSIATATAFVVPTTASACGGFFCNRQPIDQSGENIVFAVEEDGTMETHVQILYQGTAEEFAWILPIPSLPEVSVGTDALFQQIRQSTNPSFPLNYERTGECRPTPYCDYDDDYLFGEADGRGGMRAGPPADPAAPGVDVLLQEAVGPYDAVVLASTDAMALFDWLTDNGYDIPEASVPLIMEYITDGSVFLALKLQQDRGTGEIQPVVLRYEERKPCVPIKLTSIATVPDMPVTAYILGDRRARPSNYMHTEPDLDDPGFWLSGESYVNAVSRAVDDAGGQAFVTDYAGETPTLSLSFESIDDLRTQTDPGLFLMRLQERGFNGDTQLLGILLRHIPPPEGVAPNQFYNCLTNGFCGDEYDAYIAGLGFDPVALVDALNEAIIEPRNQAQSLVDRHAQLTRLFTTMSAEEMTLDPLFDLDEDVAQVSNIHEATYLTECAPEYFEFDAPQTLLMPSGREHVIEEGIAYPGDDDDYCDDRRGGMYGPYVDPGTAAATAARRGIELGGGGGCNVSGGGGLGFALLAAFGVLLGRRRRR